MIGTRCSVLLALLAAALPAQQSEHRTYDLRVLLRPRPENGGGLALPVTLPLSSVSAEAEPNDGRVYGYPPTAIPAEQLMQLIQKCFGEGEASELVGGRLHLREQAAVHEQVRDLLGALEESVRPQLELELHFLTGDIQTPDSVLGAQAAAELLRSHPPEASHRCRICGDVPARIRSATHQAFVRDYDVQVAAQTVMYDPKVDVIFDGLNAGVLATVLADGRIHLTFAIQESEIERPIALLKLRGKDQGQVHQPTMNSRTMAGAGIIEAGGALVLGAAAKPYGLCVVRVKLASPPPRIARTGRFHAVPLGDLAHPIPRFVGAMRPFRPGEEAQMRPDPEPPQRDSWFDALQQIVGEPDPKFGWSVLANHVIVHSGEKEPDRLREKLREWAAARHTLRLRVRAGRVGTDEAKRFLASASGLDAFVEKIPELGSIAALPDRSFLFMNGSERKFVLDYDVEIAQAAQAANPVMGTAFSGTSFSGVLNPTADGASFTGRFLMSRAAFEKLDTDMIRARDLDLLRSALVEQRFTAVRLRNNEWTVLLVQPTREKDYAVLALRLARD